MQPATPEGRARSRSPVVSPASVPLPAWRKRLRSKVTVVPKLSPALLDDLDVAAIEVRSLQGNPDGVNFDRAPTTHCKICGVAKHTIKWEMRMTAEGRKVCTGSQCYPCVRACVLLGCTRAVEVLRRVPLAMQCVVARSKQVKSQLRQSRCSDCTCALCVPLDDDEDDE